MNNVWRRLTHKYIPFQVAPGTYDHGTSSGRDILPIGHSVVPLNGISGMNIVRDSMRNTDNDFENIDLSMLGLG